MKQRFLATLAVALMAILPSEAKVWLPSIWGDGMVIQRNDDVLFWGKSTNKKVTITPSWCDAEYSAKVAKDGRWSVRIPTPDAGGPYEITYDDGEKLVLSNVLLGEVWLCIGQSNMVMPLIGFGTGGQSIEGSTDLILTAKESQPIRLYKAKVTPTQTPQEDVEGKWSTNSPENVAQFSAVAYFFAQKLQSTIDVPVGLLSINQGGTTIETWMAREWLQELDMGYDFSKLDRAESPELERNTPSCHFNGMFAPAKGFAIKGAIWYQGEANRANADDYLKLFPRFLQGIRDHFDGGEFPLYFVQVAPFGSPTAATSNVYVREIMSKLTSITTRTGMVAITDCGEANSIHPRYKRPVGERLAYWALSDAYGLGTVDCRAPEYKSMSIATDKTTGKKVVKVTMEHYGVGVNFAGRDSSKLFEIAGEDRVFYPAQIKLNGSGVVNVWSDDVAEPVAVRYGYKDYVTGDLFGGNGMAVSSFRTDDWEL